MPVRLFVGNLPYETTEAELREHFGPAGTLSHVFIPVDRETGRPRGFAFVEFADRAPAEDAIAKFNGQPFKGRSLSVSEARARDDRPAGGGMGGPRPSGPPRTDWTPRPPGPPRPMGGGPPPSAAPGDSRARNFGPDAPRRGKAKPKGPRREDKPTGPIPIRTHGRIYDVDDPDEMLEEPDFDDFSKSLPDDEDDNA
jgi:RNA recognition motif-containing protein